MREILEEIYSTLDIVTALHDLNPIERGQYYVMDCPECGKHPEKAFLYKNSAYIQCNRRSKCGASVSLWDYIQTKNSLTNSETLRELARLANYTLPDINEDHQKRAEEIRTREDVLKHVYDLYRNHLWEDEGKEVFEYLKKRDYTEDDIKRMGLGASTGIKKTVEFLKNKGYQVEINEKKHITINGDDMPLKWLHWREDHRLVIPYRDQIGRIKGLIGRLIRPLNEGEKEVDKYKPFTEAEGIKNTPFLLDKVIRGEAVIFVEGYLDALLLDSRGCKGVIALGGADLLDKQLEIIHKYGTKSIVLCLDNDEAGRKGTEKALAKIGKVGIRAYVTRLPDGFKDPDEYVRSNGIESFKKIISEAIIGVKWQAHNIFSKYNIETDIGFHNALDEAIEFEETLLNPLASEQFKAAIRVGLEISQDVLDELTTNYHEKKSRERLRKGYQEFFRDGQRLLNENSLKELREFVDGRTKELRAKAIDKVIKPSSLEELLEEIKRSREGLETGFESLDKLITIPYEAITIVAARPSHGKTTFLMNLYLNMIQRYPAQSFFFFSYEESKKQVELKLLNILSDDTINQSRNIIDLENYLRGDNASRTKIESGKSLFKEFADSQRLWIIDQSYYVEDLAETMTYLTERYDVGAFFIDYIQKIKIKEKYSMRQLELQKISEKILEAALELKKPVILSAQLGRDRERKNKVRLDNLREAGDIEQDANLVIGIYNEAMEKAQEEEEQLQDPQVPLKLTILKNRNGIVNSTATLSFYRPTLKIFDEEVDHNKPF